MQVCKISNSSSAFPLKLVQGSEKSSFLNKHSSGFIEVLLQGKAQEKPLDFFRVTERGEFQVSNEALQALGVSSSNLQTAHLENDCKAENLKPMQEIYDEEGRLLELMAIDGSVHYSVQYQDNITKILNVLTGEIHLMERNGQGHLIRETYPSGLEVLYAWNGEALSAMTLPDHSQITYLDHEGEGTTIQRFSSQRKLLFQQVISLNEQGEIKVHPFNGSPLIKHSYDEKAHCFITQSEALHLIEQLDEKDNLVSRIYKDPKTGIEQLENCPSGDLLVDKERKLDEQNRISSAKGWKCSYDENGRLIEKRSSSNVISYQYDALDRLTHIKQRSLEIEYTYDFLGRRLSKTKREKGETSKEFYIYHGMNEMGVYDEENQPIHLKVPALQVHPYVCLAGSIESKGKTYVPFYNSNLNIAQLIDAETQEIHHYESLDPFAENLSELNPICPWIYQGKHFDEDTGLINFIHRQYDPSIQQWTSKDPDPNIDSKKLYIYCENNPYQYIDPDGKWGVNLVAAWRCAKVGGAIAGGWGFAAGALIGLGLGAGAQKGLEKIVQKVDNKDIARALMGVGGALIGAAIDKVQEMPAFPDRELPRYPKGNAKGGEPIPDTDAPHTQLGHRQSSRGDYPQAREFGENGEPIRDIDFTDHCRPQDHPLPHQHQYKDNPTGGTKARGKTAEMVPEWEYEND